jgi:hypothetical protein
MGWAPHCNRTLMATLERSCFFVIELAHADVLIATCPASHKVLENIISPAGSLSKLTHYIPSCTKTHSWEFPSVCYSSTA